MAKYKGKTLQARLSSAINALKAAKQKIGYTPKKKRKAAK